MKRTLLCIMILMMACPATNAAENRDMEIVRGVYYVGVYNSVNFIEEIKAFTTQRKGYVKYYSDDRIVMRIPVWSMRDLRNFVAEKAYINDEQNVRENVGLKIMNARVSLKTKEKLLKDLFKVMDDSGFTHTVEIEKEISKVIVEIEKLKGRLRYLKDRIKMAEVTLYLNERIERDTGQRVFTSEWPWIRNLGIDKMIHSF